MKAAALVKSGEVAEAQVDAACRRILEAKYKLGLFENPYRYLSEERCKSQIMSAEKIQLSKEAAMKSMVLLKNAHQLLPLSPEKKLAFIGPLVKDQRNLIGAWSGAGEASKALSIWQALEAKFAGHKFLYAKGCNLVDDAAMMKKLNHDGAQLTIDEKTPTQLIAEAVHAAQESDLSIVVLGESFSMSGEAASRSEIALFENQVDLLKALKKTGKPIVLVLMNGRPLTLNWEDSNMDAILETWFAGSRAGEAIVDVLFGNFNPSGKLTMSFPRSVGQIPVYYNHKNTGRPCKDEGKYNSKYLDVSNDPLYPFGYGLSYTAFNYEPLSLSSTVLPNNGSITINTTVTNIGKSDGVETVQLYLRDMVGSITRPVKELKGFQKVSLKANESKTVAFKLTRNDLRFYDSKLEYLAQPGDFKVFVGSNSRDLKEASFKLVL